LTTVTLAVPGVDRPTILGLCRQLRSLIDESHADLVTCDVSTICACDFLTIDALARLGLTVRRLGCSLQLQGASDGLVALIAFSGLQSVLPLSA
jgi:ABC-type transporter Mla MlaB component